MWIFDYLKFSNDRGHFDFSGVVLWVFPESNHILETNSFISPFIVNADQCPTSPGRFQYYNGDTKVCCNGTLYDRNKDSKEEVGCCGGKRKREREVFKYTWIIVIYILITRYIILQNIL